MILVVLLNVSCDCSCACFLLVMQVFVLVSRCSSNDISSTICLLLMWLHSTLSVLYVYFQHKLNLFSSLSIVLILRSFIVF